MSAMRPARDRVLQPLFLDHPRSLGETYLEHQRRAFALGLTMMAAGFACVLHGLVPAMFLDTASRTVARLHQQMAARRARPAGIPV